MGLRSTLRAHTKLLNGHARSRISLKLNQKIWIFPARWKTFWWWPCWGKRKLSEHSGRYLVALLLVALNPSSGNAKAATRKREFFLSIRPTGYKLYRWRFSVGLAGHDPIAAGRVMRLGETRIEVGITISWTLCGIEKRGKPSGLGNGTTTWENAKSIIFHQ